MKASGILLWNPRLLGLCCIWLFEKCFKILQFTETKVVTKHTFLSFFNGGRGYLEGNGMSCSSLLILQNRTISLIKWFLNFFIVKLVIDGHSALWTMCSHSVPCGTADYLLRMNGINQFVFNKIMSHYLFLSLKDSLNWIFKSSIKVSKLVPLEYKFKWEKKIVLEPRNFGECFC